MLEEIEDAVEQIAVDEEVITLVIAGAEERAFCAGIDAPTQPDR